MTERILVVAAHPDDEALGCGGTMARHAATGDDVHVLFLADGEGARRDAGGVDERMRVARAAADALGARAPEFLSLPDNRLDSLDLLDIVRRVEEAVDRIGPAVVYTHHRGDLNVDHRIACQVVLTACRPLPGRGVREIYGFEVPSSTEWAAPSAADAFLPHRWVDVTAQMAAKRRALECYAAEMRPFPHPRSFEAVEALARWRGASAGLKAAEAFMTFRIVVS